MISPESGGASRFWVVETSTWVRRWAPKPGDTGPAQARQYSGLQCPAFRSVAGRQFEVFFAAASAASFSWCLTTLIMFVGARFPS
jgi:hypothetical protein